MIELEIQGLSERREGLLIEVGRAVVASGFTLQRQRLTQDVNGVLLTLVVRGPERKQRALEAALDAHERIISFATAPFVDGESRPHFAAARSVGTYTPPPAPAPVAAAVPAPASAPVAVLKPATVTASAPPIAPINLAPVVVIKTRELPETVAPRAAMNIESTAQPAPPPKPMPVPEPEPDFAFIAPSPPAPVAAALIFEPFVELIPEGPDEHAVERTMRETMSEYPKIFPWIVKLDVGVSPAARESSLLLAGQRLGAWVSERHYANAGTMGLSEALDNVAIPALRALVEIEHKGGQVHIRNSPLCAEDGHSSCVFFSGYLEGLLGRVLASGDLSIFPVGCRSCGAGECILALSD